MSPKKCRGRGFLPYFSPLVSQYLRLPPVQHEHQAPQQENATKKITELLTDNDEPFLRISITGGGCAGFSYTFNFDDAKQEDDFEIGNIVVDSMSMQYLQGATIKYKTELMGSNFVIENPNATNKCGCGSSFAV